jgi:nitrate/nitrite-specific signal transduction histidine kinase
LLPKKARIGLFHRILLLLETITAIVRKAARELTQADGAIGNYWANYHVATTEEIQLLQALADTTSVALENVRVYTELEQRVRDRTLELQTSNKLFLLQNQRQIGIIYLCEVGGVRAF